MVVMVQCLIFTSGDDGHWPRGVTIADAAQIVGKSPRTIRRWVKAGLDISDREALMAYSNQMDLNAKGETHARSLERLSGNQTQAEVNLADLPEAGEPGAAKALKRLETLETQFYARVQAALATNNQKLISAARNDHSQIAETLRKYEKEIEESKRDLGHLIPRGEAEEAVRMASVWLRLTVMSWISSHMPALLAQPNPIEAKIYFLRTFSEILEVQMMNAKDATAALPEWGEAIIRDEFRA